jgi:serine/threonine-protein kinase HipA
MSGYKHRLNAYLGQECIATLSLTDENALHFAYEEHWQKQGYALSPHLPIDNSAADNQFSIKVFFQNLFPEGENFEVLLQNFHLSRYNVFAVTRVLGLDLPGALQLIPDTTQLPTDSNFRKIEPSEIIERLRHYDAQNLIVWDGKPRLSLAGVHQKINVLVNETGDLGFGEGKLSSTHILKFERKPEQHLVLNEFLMMKLAQYSGLNVAEVELKHYGGFFMLLVSRFDRAWIDNVLYRRHLIDGCQALNLLPEYKYERHLGSDRDVKDIREGANFPDLFNFCELFRNPAVAKKQLLEWALFNLIIGNWDAHGKNLSFFVSPLGIEMAPAYDLINIRVYPDFAQEFAMALGDEFDAINITAYQLAEFADSCSISKAILAKMLSALCDKVASALPRLNELTDPNAFSNQLILDINAQVKHLKKQSELITSFP